MGMSIFPSGDVAVCDKMHGVKDFTYGNVFDAGLKAIWNGDSFAALRARIIDPKVIDPDCVRCSKLHHCRTSCFVDSFNATGILETLKFIGGGQASGCQCRFQAVVRWREMMM